MDAMCQGPRERPRTQSRGRCDMELLIGGSAVNLANIIEGFPAIVFYMSDSRRIERPYVVNTNISLRIWRNKEASAQLDRCGRLDCGMTTKRGTAEDQGYQIWANIFLSPAATSYVVQSSQSYFAKKTLPGVDQSSYRSTPLV